MSVLLFMGKGFLAKRPPFISLKALAVNDARIGHQARAIRIQSQSPHPLAKSARRAGHPGVEFVLPARHSYKLRDYSTL